MIDAISRQLKSPHLLPESAEGLFLRYGFNSCAIVGNSGSMLYARFGPRIDTHDVVFRINQVSAANRRDACFLQLCV